MKKNPPHEKVGAMSPALFIFGLVCIAFASVMAFMLSLSQIQALSLPGCGPGSACAQAAASVWGKVPVIDWPVSFAGFAYFVGAAVAWCMSRRGVSPLFRWVARFGAFVSSFFILIIVVEHHHCSYCIASHAGNLIFWLMMERAPKAATPSFKPFVALGVMFLLTSAVLGLTEWKEKQVVEQQHSEDLAESTDAIIAAGNQHKAITHTSDEPVPAGAEPTNPETADASAQPETVEAVPEKQGGEAGAKPTESQPAAADESAVRPPWGDAPFTGRWLWGKEKAKVRLVMYTDYQCRDCNRIEDEIRDQVMGLEDVSISIKHFPMCSECNPGFTEQHNMHPNACKAARAAEAAGILRGNKGFWQMHSWLFDRDGSFGQEDLTNAVRDMGYDPVEFFKVMFSDETLVRVQSDIDEGVWLGLHYTPMVFVNGIQLRGIFAKNGVPRAVDRLLKADLPALTAVVDKPPPALEKCIDDWRLQPVRRMPPDEHAWTRGPENAKVRIVVISDYQNEVTGVADKIIQDWMADHPEAQYTFKHCPFDQSCNSHVGRTVYANGCLASRAAEAAALLGGLEGYWKMHDWLLSHQAGFSRDVLLAAVPTLGFDAAEFAAALENPDVAAAVEEDCAVTKPMLYRGIPTLYVNDKVLPRWQKGDSPLLERILNEAYEGRDEIPKPPRPGKLQATGE